MKVQFLSFQENTDVIGVKYLHAWLKLHGHDSSILLLPNAKPANVQAALEHLAPVQAFALSAMTYEYARAREFALLLKKRFPTVPIIMGGIHPTSDPEGCLEIADVVVLGEGEETLLEVLAAQEGGGGDKLKNVRGIVYRDPASGRALRTGMRETIRTLDALPHPGHLPDGMSVVHDGAVHSVREPLIYRKYARYQGTFLSILTSRGCPFHCQYCCNSLYGTLYSGNSLRARSAAGVVEEIVSEVNEFGRERFLYVNFQDDCFLMHPLDWLEEFAGRYRRQVGLPFIVRTTARHITPDKLALLKKAGLRWVFMGLQTGSDRVNREIYGRNVTAAEFLDAAQAIADAGLSPWYDVILDNPYETDDDHMRTLDVLLRTPRPYQLEIFSLDFFPGTGLRQRALDDGLILPKPGEKSYTVPEPKTINKLIRMSPTLPRSWMTHLVRKRKGGAGRLLIQAGYLLCLCWEPLVYLRLIHRANDLKMRRTLRNFRFLCLTALKKLLLRRQG